MKVHVLSFFAALLLMLVLVFSTSTTGGSMVATIKEIRHKEIVVENTAGEVITLSTPVLVLKSDYERYNIHYTKKIWGKLRLTNLIPIHSSNNA